MKKVVCAVIGFLIAISLIAASCAPAAPTTAPATTTPATTAPTTPAATTPKPGTKGPVYGGTLTFAIPANILRFTTLGSPFYGETYLQTNQTIIEGDWARGPAGTGEFEWTKGAYGSWDSCKGLLVESWEIPEAGTVIWNIRKGVRFYIDPNPNNAASRLVNGREFTAQDMVKCHELICTVPGSAGTFSAFRFATHTALDKWTVVTKISPEIFDDIRTSPMYNPLFAPELYERGIAMNDWRNSVGTGAFMLKDFVDGSSAVLVRNPTYWEKDPVGPGKGNQLPYVDSIRFNIIPDASTILAAFRTGKIDILNSAAWEDAEALIKANPKLLYKKYFGDARHAIAMRTDKPGLPFQDKRVRRALMMATDFEAIKNTWGGGDAQINTFPIHYTKEDAAAFLPLEEAPASVQELYKYNPEKARALLAEAGYPRGFKTKVTCANFPGDIDYLSIIKDQWAKVGIELTLDPREPGTFTSIRADRVHEEMIHQGGAPNANLFLASAFDGVTRAGNLSYVTDSVVREAKARWSPLTLSDPLKAMQIHKDLMKYVLDQAWVIPGVNPRMYHVWWPWVQNYRGEFSLGRGVRAYARYVWIDQDMKKAMGY